MVAVFLSGVIGRFIYIQIPRTDDGRELSLNEVKNLKTDIGEILKDVKNLDQETYNSIIQLLKSKVGLYYKNFMVKFFKTYGEDKKTLKEIKSLIKNKLHESDYSKIIKLAKQEISLNRKIERLNTMHDLLKYWHVAHLPFAFVMLIVMIIHVVITVLFGYRWVF